STAFSVFTVRAAPRSPPLSLHDALPIYRPNAAETVEHYAKSPLIGRYSYLYCCIGYCCIVAALRCRVTDGRLFVAPIIAYLSLRSEEHTSELQSRENLVCRLLLEKKKQR